MLKTIVRGWLWGMILSFAGFAMAQSSNTRYVAQGDTVYDEKTDLSWKRCSVGQQWKLGIGCVGDVETFNFDDAQRQGSGGWRVPTKEELSSLIDRKRADNLQKPTIDEAAFPNMDTTSLRYWTSTSNAESAAWYVSFGDGGIYNYGYGYHADPGAVRLVRSGH